MDSSNVEEIITCGICLETFNGDSRCPRMLNCGHSFCHSCLEKLIEQSPFCPTCKKRFRFKKASSIAINFSLKSLLDIQPAAISSTISSIKALDLKDGESSGSYTCAARHTGTKSKSFLSEGHCDEHNTYLGMRCMDCEVWICGMCSTIRHKNCRTLLVEEAYFEMKKPLSIKVEAELEERNATFERIDEFIRILEEEKKCLIEEIKKKEEEIKKKEQELKDREKRIRDLESSKSDGRKFCQKLERLHGLVESSSNSGELSKAIGELEKMLELQKNEIPDSLYQLHQPITIKFQQLDNWCTTGSVYVQEDRFDGTKYGKVTVKDGRVLVHNFQPEKPQARLFQFKELLFKFNASSELPNTAFLRLTSMFGGYEEVDVLIQTEGNSPRAKNFLHLCSGLKGSTYIGLTLQTDFSNGCQLSSGPDPVVEGIRNDDALVTLMEAGVYGTTERSSRFQIQLRDCKLVHSSHKFGSVVAGLQNLQVLIGGNVPCPISDCGLVL